MSATAADFFVLGLCLYFFTCIIVVSCLAHSSTLKMEVTCSFEMSVNFQWTTQYYIADDRILYIYIYIYTINFIGYGHLQGTCPLTKYIPKVSRMLETLMEFFFWKSFQYCYHCATSVFKDSKLNRIQYVHFNFFNLLRHNVIIFSFIQLAEVKNAI
jgi:hypothetical protein